MLKSLDARVKPLEESVQRALVRVHKNAHEINLMKTDLYPIEHPNRKAVNESEEEIDNHACMRETLRQIADQECVPSRHGKGNVCSPCHARSYFDNVEARNYFENVESGDSQ